MSRSGKFFAHQPEVPNYTGPEIMAGYLPDSERGETVHHRHFSLSYLEEFELAQWVAYELTIEELNASRVPRYDRFNPDYSVSTRTGFYRDYSNSGYTRGHLAPAADMGFDSLAMRESFYMSNISPQTRAFNGGIWRELEEQTRDWARERKRLYIVTGPVLYPVPTERIGENRIAVPSAFYKVLLAPDDSLNNHIAFIIPNTISERPLDTYAVTIDSVEKMTGIDFFPLLDEKLDEASLRPEGWSYDAERYHTRLKEWNKQ
jgi:endonuclease G